VACLVFFCLALPSSTLGLLWPSIRVDYHEPVAALGVLLVFGVSASVVASVGVGRLLARWSSSGAVLVVGTGLTAVGLEIEACTPALWMFGGGVVVFGIGSGAVDSAVNAHAARYFGARRINWVHAGYGAGATLGPLLATALLSTALTWRWVYGIMGVVQAVLALAMIPAARTAPPEAVSTPVSPPVGRPSRRARGRTAVVLGSLAFIAVETGLESGAEVWGFVFLTDGRGLTPVFAGVVVSAYWGMMFLGRVVGGAVAERVGAVRVLGASVVCVVVGCVLMVGSGVLAVVGLMIVGLAASPLFPLFTLTTAERVGGGVGAAEMVGLQVGVSAIGSAVLPAGIGLVVGAFGAGALAPPLLLLSVIMCVLYGLLITRAAG
jgi:fucose permease